MKIIKICAALLLSISSAPAAAQPSPIATNESVIFYESLGNLTEDGTSWELDVHGGVYANVPHPTLEQILAADAWARREAGR